MHGSISLLHGSLKRTTHQRHCLCCTRALHVKFAACPASFDTLSCRHSCWRDPSTVVRTLQAVNTGQAQAAHQYEHSKHSHRQHSMHAAPAKASI